jgi:uncharacterized coiled-coil protein SlyX
MLQSEIAQNQAEIAQNQEEMARLVAELTALPSLPSESEIALRLSQIESSIADLETRQSALEDVILEDPVKALQIPLLQREIESLRENQEVSLLAIKDNQDQVYKTNRTVLLTLAVSIIFLAIRQLSEGRESKE